MKRRIITAAETEGSDRFQDASDELKDNFDFISEAFDKLSRNGKESENQALQLMLELNSSIESITKKVAQLITE